MIHLFSACLSEHIRSWQLIHTSDRRIIIQLRINEQRTPCIIVILFSACYSLRSVTLQFFSLIQDFKKIKKNFLLSLILYLVLSSFSFSYYFLNNSDFHQALLNFFKILTQEGIQLHLISKLLISSFFLLFV